MEFGHLHLEKEASAFAEMLRDPVYRAAMEHRQATVADSCLSATPFSRLARPSIPQRRHNACFTVSTQREHICLIIRTQSAKLF